MATLFDYQQQVQRFMRDAKQEQLNPQDLVEYVNRARREVAMRAQCIRRLTPISGSIISIEVTDGGTGYSNAPTITISDPDFPSGQGPYPSGSQATASAIVVDGIITQITVEDGGAGYWQPSVTITDNTGTGAETADPEMTFINQLSQGQEVYNFSDVDLSMFPGVESIYMIKSVSLLFSSFRYSLACYSMSTYQSLVRQWAQQWQYVPAVCAQFGQGTGGSFYMYPIPSQAYQLEFDAFCLPSPLIDNQSVEAIPDPWTDAIPYFAASLAFEELQNLNSAQYYFKKFDTMVDRYASYARPGRVTNPYGRY